jgi:hypothetical protein
MPISYIQDAELGRVRVNDFDGFLGKINHPSQYIADAIDTSVFFARELEQIKAQSYDVKYANLKFREVFPVSNAAAPGTKTITYRTYDQTGIAKFIGSYGKDIPRADIGGKETTISVKTMAISYGFTTAEIRSQALSGLPLDSRKAMAAVRGVEQTHNEVAFFGNATQGLIGLFSNPNIPTGSAPNGAGGNPEWPTKTPDEILLDLNAAVNDIYTNTLMVEAPDTLLLSPERRAYIATTPRSSNSDTTILQYFVQNNEWIASTDSVVACNECSAAVQNAKGLGNREVMVAYRNSPDAMELEIPMELMYHPEQREGLEIMVPGEASTGGLNIYYPLSLNIREDI